MTAHNWEGLVLKPGLQNLAYLKSKYGHSEWLLNDPYQYIFPNFESFGVDKKDLRKIRKPGFPWSNGYLIANSTLKFWISFLMERVDSLLDCASQGYREDEILFGVIEVRKTRYTGLPRIGMDFYFTIQ